MVLPWSVASSLGISSSLFSPAASLTPVTLHPLIGMRLPSLVDTPSSPLVYAPMVECLPTFLPTLTGERDRRAKEEKGDLSLFALPSSSSSSSSLLSRREHRSMRMDAKQLLLLKAREAELLVSSNHSTNPAASPIAASAPPREGTMNVKAARNYNVYHEYLTQLMEVHSSCRNDEALVLEWLTLALSVGRPSSSSLFTVRHGPAGGVRSCYGAHRVTWPCAALLIAVLSQPERYRYNDTSVATLCAK
jgi:hypothetical protein